MSKITGRIRPGDTVCVKHKVIEGDKERIQVIEGIVIAKKHGAEPGGTVTVRRIASGVGVEFVFPIHSPKVLEIKVIKKSKSRRAKLYYLRDRIGRAARVKEDRGAIIEEEVAVPEVKQETKEEKEEKEEKKQNLEKDKKEEKGKGKKEEKKENKEGKDKKKEKKENKKEKNKK